MTKRGGLSPKTVADLRSVLLMRLEYARRNQYPCAVDHKVFYPQTFSHNVQILSKTEQKKLEQVLLGSDEPLALGILLTLYSGLRIGELCALQWKNINLDDKCLNIIKTAIRIRDVMPDASKKTKVIIDRPKKESSVRLIPIVPFLAERLEKYQRSEERYLLTGTESCMEPRVCLAKYKKILQQANLRDYTFHTLRHTFATRCVENGFDPKSLSEILGHASVSTTLRRYVHPSMESKRKQIERLCIM